METFERGICAIEASRNAKINELNNTSVWIKDNVARIDVFMDDICRMDSAQSIGNGDRQPKKTR